ncbi:MAG: UDP-2,3-diacylglucosamine diphosphatase [Bdellovibrionales bacterium]|nr:UDP-2,3-diacylglucosamine diphosphatase [Bdellovibrionales bacterium]
MTQAWFVSDIHMSDMQDQKAKTFLAFLHSLNQSRPCSHLFLVGDIFDLWVGDHNYFQKKFDPIVSAIKKLKSEGVEIYYFEGNHDLHLERFWSKTLDITVYSGPWYFPILGKMVRVEHGDQSDPDDKGYLFLRTVLRTPVMRWLSYNLPGSLVNAIGEKASSKSRDYTSQTKTIDEEVAREKLHRHAVKAYEEESYDLMIYGHVHLRDEYKGVGENEKSYEAINLGTWLDTPCAYYLSSEGTGFEDL